MGVFKLKSQIKAGLQITPLKVAFVCSLLLPIRNLHAQNVPDYERPPISYSQASASNRISQLSLSDAFKGKSSRELLPAVLQELKISPESQVLVFSKTSLQRRHISPEAPRAIYFSDDAYIGFVPGGVIEATITDPQLGLVFYQLNPSPSEARFERDASCLNCHAGSMTRDHPGLMIRSVFTDAQGEPMLSAGTFLVEHDTPFTNRWGGWYVTGRHGSLLHMGNVTASGKTPEPVLNRKAGANLTDLSQFFDTTQYLRKSSDIVALMVLEHQVGMHNKLARGLLRTRYWMHYQQQLQKELGEPVSSEPTGTALSVVRSEAEAIVDYLLFREEATLPPEGISGDARFQEAFRQNRIRDARGRSLKDFDLKRRLFQFPCSYMIYSEAFRSLPVALKGEVYRQLFEALNSSEGAGRYGYLKAADKESIREILEQTLPEITEAWKRLALSKTSG